MRLTYDEAADAAYVYLVPEIRPGEVHQTRVSGIRLDQAAINVDFDADGRILGIELLGASRLLRRESLP